MATEAPSKTVLLERRAERTLVREGKSVLEDRRDLLAHMLVEQTAVCHELLARAQVALADARGLLRRAIMRHGNNGLIHFSPGESPMPAPDWRVENRLGAPWVHGDTAPGVADSKIGEGVEVSVELEAARRAFDLLLAVLLPLAAAENNLARLVDVFRRTQRRVNALEHIILPDLNQAIKHMEDRMDEMERDDLVRSLLIKRRQQYDTA